MANYGSRGMLFVIHYAGIFFSLSPDHEIIIYTSDSRGRPAKERTNDTDLFYSLPPPPLPEASRYTSASWDPSLLTPSLMRQCMRKRERERKKIPRFSIARIDFVSCLFFLFEKCCFLLSLFSPQSKKPSETTFI